MASAGGITDHASVRLTFRRTNIILRLFLSEYLVLILSLAWFLCAVPFTPEFGSWPNLANIISSMLPLLVLAVGQTYVLISGGIDLSVTSTVALASVVGGLVMNGETGWFGGSFWAVPAGLGAMLACGAVVGVCNGAAVTQLKMPPFIVTLTAMMFVSGFAIWLTQSRNMAGLPPAFNAIGGQTGLAVLVTALFTGVAHLGLTRTLFGQWLYAVGHNARAAFISGVPVGRITLLAYVVSGLCAAVASVLYTGRLETGSPVHGQRVLLDVIAATVIGGTSLFGGKGKIVWTLFGALFLTLIDNSLNLLNLSHFTIMMVKGGVILLAALTDSLRRKWFAA
jgi:ribose/xylose/arabinose/galactoside ABC-type transport system permease subunit